MISALIIVTTVGVLMGAIFAKYIVHHELELGEAIAVGAGGALLSGTLGYLATPPSMSLLSCTVTGIIGAAFFLLAATAGADFLSHQQH